MVTGDKVRIQKRCVADQGVREDGNAGGAIDEGAGDLRPPHHGRDARPRTRKSLFLSAEHTTLRSALQNYSKDSLQHVQYHLLKGSVPPDLFQVCSVSVPRVCHALCAFCALIYRPLS